MAIEFIITEKKPGLTKPILLEGLPGLGLVGTIAANYMVEKLKMKPYGYIISEKFPPLIAVHNHVPEYPIRLYYSKQHNLIVLLSEFIIPLSAVKELSDEIYTFCKKEKVKQIISLGSINIKGAQDTVYIITSDKKDLEKIKKLKKVELIKEGATTGVTAMLLAKGAVEKLPVISLLAEANPEYVDPKAASMVLQTLNSLLNLKICTAQLDKEAKEMEKRIEEIIHKGQDAQKQYKEIEGGDNFSSMYG
ncbi:MAG: PAC2 family protein [Candidatus Micrarchaeia archaeon]|jgi:uncharacterized protein (TIGR00161 family)